MFQSNNEEDEQYKSCSARCGASAGGTISGIIFTPNNRPQSPEWKRRSVQNTLSNHFHEEDPFSAKNSTPFTFEPSIQLRSQSLCFPSNPNDINFCTSMSAIQSNDNLSFIPPSKAMSKPLNSMQENNSMKAMNKTDEMPPMKRSLSVNDSNAIQSIDFIPNRFNGDSQMKQQNVDQQKRLNDSNPNKHWKATFVPPQPLRAPLDSRLCRPLTSFSVDQTRDEVMAKLTQILNQYADDIDFSVQNGTRIDGVVFMADHNEVFFMISIFDDDPFGDDVDNHFGARGPKSSGPRSSGYRSRSTIEFIRKSGGSLPFARFWNDVRTLYLNATRPRSEWISVPKHYGRDYGDVDVSELPPLELRDGQCAVNELEEFCGNLRANDQFVADFIRIFCDCQLGKTVQEQEVLNHEKTICALIQCAMNQYDIRMARGAFLILTAVIEKCNEWKVKMALIEHQGLELMRSIICGLNSQSVLVQKHAIRLLSALSTMSMNIDWNGMFKSFGDGLDAKRSLKSSLRSSCRQFAVRWNGMKHGIEQAMFERIEQTVLR